MTTASGTATPAPSLEYRTRLWVGLLMVLAATGLLLGDQYLAPLYPCLLTLILLLALAACRELHSLLIDLPRPPLALLVTTVAATLLAGWPSHLGWTGSPAQPWRDIQWTFTACCLLAFLWEMGVYREPGSSVVRLALTLFTLVYLGLFPSFMVQLRWWPPTQDVPDWRGMTSFALAVFVPKVGDIGAYFTGRFLGRHRMTPVLSPKKTWEGLAGGLAAAAGVAVLLNRLPGAGGGRQLLPGGDLEAVGFGLAVGIAGVLGDLAESLIKRDRSQKDASRTVPGFGGVLDVIDSIVFAAPVAYWWLRG